MNKFLKTGLVATAAVALSLVGFGEVFGYGGGGGGGGAGGNNNIIVNTTRSSQNLSVVINAGAETSNALNVTLSINAGAFTGMALSNTADFADSVVIPAASTATWTLASGNGEKTVFVKFFTANGSSFDVISDSIALAMAPQAVLGEKITDSGIDALIAVTHFGQTGADVKSLQDALKKAGFFPAGISSTGFYGPVTKASVAKYLASTKAPAQVLGDKITDIDSLIAQVRFGQRSNAVVALQNALKAKGFFPAGIPATGFYGPITKVAVEKYLAQ
jgi:peptidoglycan hydrolase-like protein with peptidoglycan-binding domain